MLGSDTNIDGSFLVGAISIKVTRNGVGDIPIVCVLSTKTPTLGEGGEGGPRALRRITSK